VTVASPTVKRVVGVCPTVKRERGERMPNSETERGGEKARKPATESTTAQGRAELTNSETGKEVYTQGGIYRVTHREVYTHGIQGDTHPGRIHPGYTEVHTQGGIPGI